MAVNHRPGSTGRCRQLAGTWYASNAASRGMGRTADGISFPSDLAETPVLVRLSEPLDLECVDCREPGKALQLRPRLLRLERIVTVTTKRRAYIDLSFPWY